MTARTAANARRKSQQATQNGNDAAAASAAASSSASTSASATAEPASPLSSALSSLTPLLSSPVASFFLPDSSTRHAALFAAQQFYALGRELQPDYLMKGLSGAAASGSAPKRLITHAPLINGKVKPATKGKSAAQSHGVPFSSDQIYAQLKLHSDPLLPRLSAQIKALDQAVREAQQLREEDEEDEKNQAEAELDDEEEEQSDDEEDVEIDEDDDEADGLEREREDEEGEDDAAEENDADGAEGADEDEEKGVGVGSYKGRGGLTEDAFFSLEDMEKFADMYDEDEEEAGEEGEDDDEFEDEDDDEDGEGDEDMLDDEGDAVDLSILHRRALRKQHEKTLKPLKAPKGKAKSGEIEDESDIDLQDDGEDDARDRKAGGARYEDFFDAPPPGLLSKSKKRSRAKSMEEYYAEEDQTAYLDEDDVDEFGGEFSQLAESQRKGLLGRSSAEVADEGGADEDGDDDAAAEAALASSPALSTKDPSKMSSYERSKSKLADQISSLEQKLVQPREWAQMGEVSGSERPVDGLLDQHLEFETASKPPPLITQEYTQDLEEIIRKRIIEQRFDDVVRKLPPPPLKGSKGAEGDQPILDTKSSVGLAEVYEQEYLDATAKASGQATKAEQASAALQQEIGHLVGHLFHKLDALCNFHFTPKSLHAEEIDIKSLLPNVSSIAMEDAMPTLQSAESHLAPQDILDVRQSDMVGASEKSKEERVAKRRKIKSQRRKKDQRVLEKERTKIAGMDRSSVEGNAEQGILRKVISSAEMRAATTARNVIQAGGKGGLLTSGKPKPGQPIINTNQQPTHNFGKSQVFFGKMMQQSKTDRKNKKQRTQ